MIRTRAHDLKRQHANDQGVGRMPDERGETGSAGLRGFWYAAVAASRLGAQPLAVRVLGDDIVLWRGADGAAHGALDRCAHRGAQLSLGEVTEGALACRYHGWRYGADGACVHVPSLTAGQRIARGVSVRPYPCAELHGYVWIWMGEGKPKPAGPRPIAEFERFDWAQGVLNLKAPALSAIENNLDWCHPVFAHPYTHGQFFMNQALGFREYEIELRLTEDGLIVFTPPTRDAAAPPPASPQVALRYDLPDRVTIAFSSGPQGPMRIVMHMVPTGPAESRQEWLVSTGPATPGQPPKLQWSDDPVPIFEQDRAVLESVQLAVAREGHGFEKSVEADAPTLLARRVYAAAAEGRWPGFRARQKPRRILRVRS
jgi:nitrite reductase/ring-hydroxylating ferredoxin subunit